MSTVKLILNTNKVFKNFNKNTFNNLLTSIYHDTNNDKNKKYNIEIMRITNNIIYNIFEKYTENLDDSVGLIIDYLLKDNSILANSTLIKIINKALLYDTKNIIVILENKLKDKDLGIYLTHVNTSKIVNHIPEAEVGGPKNKGLPGKAVNTAAVSAIASAKPPPPQGGPVSLKNKGLPVNAPAKPPPTPLAGPQSKELPNGLVKYEKMLKMGVPPNSVKSKMALNGITNEQQKLVMRVSGITEKSNDPPKPTTSVIASGVPATVTVPSTPVLVKPVIASVLPKESLSEQMAAAVAARTARGANAISGVAQIPKTISPENPLFQNIKTAAQKKTGSPFVDPRNARNDLSKIGKVVETIKYNGKRVQKKGSKKLGTIIQLNKTNPYGTYLTIRYDGNSRNTSGELLNSLTILPNTQKPATQPLPSATATAPPLGPRTLKAASSPLPQSVPIGTQGPSTVAPPSPLQRGPVASPSLLPRGPPATAAPLLRGPSATAAPLPLKSALKKSKTQWLGSKKAITFRNEQQPGKSLINTQNSKYSLENIGINTVVKTSETRKEEKHQQNINRGRPKQTMSNNKIKKVMKERDYAEQTNHNTKHAIDIGQIHASNIWKSSNNNFEKGNKH